MHQYKITNKRWLCLENGSQNQPLSSSLNSPLGAERMGETNAILTHQRHRCSCRGDLNTHRRLLRPRSQNSQRSKQQQHKTLGPKHFTNWRFRRGEKAGNQCLIEPHWLPVAKRLCAKRRVLLQSMLNTADNSPPQFRHIGSVDQDVFLF